MLSYSGLDDIPQINNMEQYDIFISQESSVYGSSTVCST